MAIPYSKLNGFIQNYKRADNISGITGVYLDQRADKWGARLNYNRKLHYGGLHITKKSAAKARLMLEFEVLGFERMPQQHLIPEYFSDPRSKALVAWKKKLEEK